MTGQLMHYAAEPVSFDPTRTYTQNEPTLFGKPEGFWVSVTGEDDWPSWCESEEFRESTLQAAHRVELTTAANILWIESVDGIDSLTAEFAVQTEYERRWVYRGDNPSKWPIDWHCVAEQWDGIIIAPYQWARRNTHDWYYGWDCASGCIWNLETIASVSVSSEVPA
ncbi:MAG: hypothetical protein E6Q97_02560 [Desulfurellales bacterium]|nr:MAG: hypothetical protein E6Q97_02560 [Desulfurellales bacterium]